MSALQKLLTIKIMDDGIILHGDFIAEWESKPTIGEVKQAAAEFAALIALLREVDERVPGLTYDYYDENNIGLAERIESVLAKLEEPPCEIARECYFGQDDKCLRGGACV